MRTVITTRLAGMAIVLSVCHIGTVASQSANNTGASPSVAAREELTRLIDKASRIDDVSATVLLGPVKTLTNITYRFACSRKLGLARIELVVPHGQSVVYFVNKHDARACGQVRKDLFELDTESSNRWLSMYDRFAAVMNTTIPQSREMYFTGTEVANAKTCALFLFEQWGLSTKLWLALKTALSIESKLETPRGIF